MENGKSFSGSSTDMCKQPASAQLLHMRSLIEGSAVSAERGECRVWPLHETEASKAIVFMQLLGKNAKLSPFFLFLKTRA
jgi:hypothetical protein